MYSSVISLDKVMAVSQLIEQAESIAIVCHMTPDGDALGSSLCLMHTLRRLGKRVKIVTPDLFPQTLAFLPGTRDIVVATKSPDLAQTVIYGTDLLFCLDFNDLKRIDRLAPVVESSSAIKIVVDHHLNPTIDASVVISHPEKSSTSVLVYILLESLGITDFVDTDAATCCCAGMMTDTGNFAYNSNDADLYSVMAQLIDKGVDKDALYVRLFNTQSHRRLRIMAYCQLNKMHLLQNHHCAVTTLSRAELDEFEYQTGDTEGLVNIPLSVPGIEYSIYLREDACDFVKVSMRSKGEFSVKQLCETYFGGGGHKNAAGGEFHGSLAEALTVVKSIISDCDALFSSND